LSGSFLGHRGLKILRLWVFPVVLAGFGMWVMALRENRLQLLRPHHVTCRSGVTYLCDFWTTNNVYVGSAWRTNVDSRGLVVMQYVVTNKLW
jgi:hypothetical protein